MTLTVTVQVPASHVGHADIVALDLDRSGVAVASQRTSVAPGMMSTFYPHATRTIQVIERGGRLSELEGAALDFGDALRALKAGLPVTRTAWAGRGMLLVLVPGSIGLTVDEGRPLAKAGVPIGTVFDYRPHIDLWSSHQFAPWSPATDDVLAEDWVALPQIAAPVAMPPTA